MSREAYARRTGFGSEVRLCLQSANGSHLLDRDGNSYLDLTSGWNVVNAGWENQEIRDAWLRNTQSLSYRPSWSTDLQFERLSGLMADLAPGYRMIPACSGSESVDNALKVARLVTGRGGVVCFAGAYHGSGTGASLGTGYDVPYLPQLGLDDRSVRLPLPDCEEALLSAETLIRGFEDAGAILFETVLTNLGCVVASDAFLDLIDRLSRELGIIMICDEIGTGINRTGSLFSSFARGLKPDILVCGKALTNGFYPLSLCLVANRIMRQMDESYFASTYAGTPSACAAALATLDHHRSRELGARAAESGAVLKARLSREIGRIDGIRSIEGAGLELALHLDWKPLRARGLSPRSLIGKLRERSIFATLSPADDHLMLIPPLTTDPADLVQAAELIVEVLE